MAAVEMALIAPLLIMMCFGAIEVGMLFRASITAQNIVRSAARAASTGGRTADYQALLSIRDSAGAAFLTEVPARVEKIIIFNASTSSVVPTSCWTASVAGVCNTYTGNFVGTMAIPTGGVLPSPNPVYANESVSATTCSGASAAIDKAWCPATRGNDLSAIAGTDYVGIAIRYRHSSITGFLFNNKTIAVQSIIKIEPKDS